MKTVTVMYMKGSDFTHLFISIDGKKFNEDKTDFIADLPIRSWFRPSDDDSFEWVGFVEEIEKATNTGIDNLSFEFKGDKNDEAIFMEELSKSGVQHDSGAAKVSFQSDSEEERGNRREQILEQAYDDLDKKNYTAAFRGFQKVSGKSMEAKFEMAQLYLFGKGVEENDAQAVELFLECEKDGFLEASSRLAQCHYYGWGLEGDDKEAYEYALKGCDAPEAYGYEAHYIAGRCLLYGQGVERNLDKAIKHLKICVDAEYDGYKEFGFAYEKKGDYTSAFKVYEAGSRVDPDCYYYLARCYEEGKGVPQDDYKAFENMKKVPDTDVGGQAALAWYYLKGTGTQQDIEKAAEICRSLSGEYPEEPDLLGAVAMTYMVKYEFEKAAEYFKRAIEVGAEECKTELGYCYLKSGKYKMAEAVLNSALNDLPDSGELYDYLGDCYYKNDSPLKDNIKAVRYYEKSVSLGNVDSMYSLAGYYSDNNDFDKAAEYYEMAAQNGHLGAKALMGAAEYDDGSIFKAVKLLEEPAQKGYTYAQYYLGKCYLKDEYSGHDYNQGIYWLSCAAEGGSGQACFYLSYIYGKEEFRDDEKSYEYDVKGYELGDEDCTYWLAYRHLYVEKYIDETKGIELLRGLIRNGVARAKYTLAEFYYGRYRLSVRKIGFFDSEDESAIEAAARIIPYVNFVGIPVVQGKKILRQKSDEKRFTAEDFANIREMVTLYKQLLNNPGDLESSKIKIVKSRLKSIKDKYRR